jgi:hypothetical protein
MSTTDNLVRRLALAVTEHAMRVLPPDRSSWARAMRQEIDHIDSDRSALRWAVGCLLASYRERVRAMDPLQTPLARSILALVIGFEAFRAWFAPLMVLSYRLGNIGVTQALGGLTPGDDYRRFIPLMDTVPGWLLGIWMASGTLFLAAAWLLVRGRGSAFGLFASAYALSMVGSCVDWWVRALIPQYGDAYRHAFIFAQFSFRRDVLLPVAGALLPAIVGVALWRIWRPRVSPSQKANS